MDVFSTPAHFQPLNSLLNGDSSKPKLRNVRSSIPSSLPGPLLHAAPSKSRLSSSSPVSVASPLEPAIDVAAGEEKFDWYSQWYPVMPVCDLDKREPHAKQVLGMDVVVWWDRNENAWKVFDDMCPHRLAPLSEGRIDPSGRLQCAYHGWCFDGNGNCKLIPQSPLDGPSVHTNKRACVASYPTVVHHDMVWFWPNSDPQYRNIFDKKKPPFIPELDDPAFTKVMAIRDIPYGYDILIENLMDPAHLPYAHYGLRDREGGIPLDFTLKKLGIEGFDAELEFGYCKYQAPCILSIHADVDSGRSSLGITITCSLAAMQPSKGRRRMTLTFMCVPVSPGNSRLIWAFPRNFDIWIDKVVPRWMIHVANNLVLDSDLYLLHIEERKIKEIGSKNWQRACFLPCKSDALVVGYRRWFNKYADGEVDWRGRFSGDLPPTPPREQLMDRYWTHVVNCRSCSRAYKSLNAMATVLEVVAIGLIGVVAAATKQGAVSAAGRTRLAILGSVCYAVSRWLAHFVQKYFRYHGYNHSVPDKAMVFVQMFRLGVAP
ncbi:unnamed protein product [Linum tenue]|uniref:Rieske domain-containing protein n=1 Tax=Linum tenue TaxID=586396 RepID=A0AAV0RJW9_9ROSI|nr:unnamed protein product [Linum tenue]